MLVLILRPREQAAAFADRLADEGITSVTAPMLEIAHGADLVAATTAAAGGVPRGLVVTSANAIAALREDTRLADLFAVPVVAVGPATATAARAAGFIAVIEADGDADAVVDLVGERFLPGDRLVHLAGRDRTGFIAERLATRGIEVAVVEAYRAEMGDGLPGEVRRDLLAGRFDAVIVASGRTAEAFRRSVFEAAPAAPLDATLVAISEAAAAPLAGLFDRVSIASEPSGDSLAESVVALKAALENNIPPGSPPAD